MLFLFLILILSSSWGVYVYSNSYMILVWNNMQHCVILVLLIEPERTLYLKSIFP